MAPGARWGPPNRLVSYDRVRSHLVPARFLGHFLENEPWRRSGYSRRRWPALGITAGIGADQLLSAAQPEEAKQEVKPAVTLPITRVVMFNSGVGYFSRSGEVTDDARVDLTFPEQDINDLLKSMVLEDFNGGRIAAVSYDSREPISRTLSSFAINLNNNPTFAGIVVADAWRAGGCGADSRRGESARQALGSDRRRGEAEGGGGQRSGDGGCRGLEHVVRGGTAQR